MRTVAMALALPLLLIAGCARPDTCPDVCVVTEDGWTLVGSELNGEAKRSILLVHGINEDRHAYDALALELASDGWRVAWFDSRGHGQSAGEGAFASFDAASFRAMETDLDAWAERLGGAPDVVVGASLGANEALRFAARQGDPQPRLVLLSAGTEYRGVRALDAAALHVASALLVASQGDAFANTSAEEIHRAHNGPTTTHVVDGSAHGTQLLDEATRELIVAWVE